MTNTTPLSFQKPKAIWNPGLIRNNLISQLQLLENNYTLYLVM